MSPNYPRNYDPNVRCTWILETQPMLRIEIYISQLELESNWRCRYDRLEVWDGQYGTPQWNRTHNLCRRSQRRIRITSSGSFMKLRFVADGSVQKRGFYLTARAVCGGYTSDTRGIITSPDYPSNYRNNLDCHWTVRALPGRTLTFQFHDIEITSADNLCSQDYLIVRNGGTMNSPLFLMNSNQAQDHQNGRLCNIHMLPPAKNTSANYLHLYFKSDGSINGKGFKLEFNQNSLGCGGRIHLTADLPTFELQTPNYPNVPPENAECVWIIMTPPDQRVQLDFDYFSVRGRTGLCSNEAVELRDGGTDTSRMIGRFCGERPSTKKSSSNIMFVKYTNSLRPNNGIKAVAKIAVCGGSLNLGSEGETIQIKSPNYPGHYATNLDCSWTITGPTGHFLSFSFVEFDLPWAFNCSFSDYVQILESVGFNGTDEVRASLCGSSPQSVVTTYSNVARLIFKTDDNNQERTGFIIRVNASVEECGGDVSGSSGIIQSPGYPTGSTAVYCLWRIQAPEGRAVKLEFLDFDLPPPLTTGPSGWTKCSRGHAYAASGHNPPYLVVTHPLLDKPYCGGETPPVQRSTTEQMTLFYLSRGSTTNRGFKARWTTEEPVPCGGVIHGPPATLTPLMNLTTSSISSPVQPAASNYSLNALCIWKVINPSQENSTAVFKADRIFIHQTWWDTNCISQFLHLDRGPTLMRGSINNDKSGTFCGQSLTPMTFRSPSPVNNVVFMSRGIVSDRGFNLTYSVSPCGGVYTGPFHRITSPNYPGNYPDDVDCAWLFEFGEGEQIDFYFEDLSMEGTCDNDYVKIFNGPRETDPELIRTCGTQKPNNVIRSMTNKAYVIFHSNGNTNQRGFRLNVTAHTTGCGGVFHGRQGNITFPRHDGNYGNNEECIWELSGEPGFRGIIDFYGRFELESSPDCQKDYLAIQQLDEQQNVWEQVGERYCGRQKPSTVTTYTKDVRIVFRSDSSITGDGFNIVWRMDCGGSFNDDEGIFSSPGYPDQYPISIRCSYIIVAPAQDFVLAEFMEPFDIENSGESGCYDYVRIREVSSNNSTKGTYCGDSLPPPVSTRGSMIVEFWSDANVPDRGFQIKYTRHQCGGLITEEKDIHSPMHPDRYHHRLNCTWKIQAPEGKAVAIKFDFLDLENNRRCIYDHISAFEGDTLNETMLLAKYCGNHSQIPPIIKSRGNVMTLQFKTDSSVSRRGFQAKIIFTYGELQGCGGTIDLSNQETAQLRSLDANNDGIYESELNCHWSIMSPPEKNIALSFSQFNVEAAENGTCWDYVEIRDGQGPFAPLVSHHCGTTTPIQVRSSTNFLWVKFFSDATTERPGFVATVAKVDPICGSLVPINVTSQTQELASPNFPSTYPSSVRCRWTLSAPTENEKIFVKFTNFSVAQSPGCNGDYLRLLDLVRGGNLYHHGVQQNNESILINGISDRILRYRWRGRYFHKDVKHCGSTLPHAFYSLTDGLQLDFVSNGDSGRGTGFKLQYYLASCNRTYDDPNGRIFSPDYPSRLRRDTFCQFNIRSQEGTTISMFFKTFGLWGGANCTRGAFEVRDGPSSSSTLLGRFCGYSIPDSIYSSGRDLWIRTFSLQYSGRGWDISYTTTTTGRGCGGTLFDTQGVVTSPGWPGNHPQGSDCAWILKVPAGERIELKFTQFSFGTQETCGTDYLQLYDVTSETQYSLVSTFCGNDIPADHVGSTNALRLRYVTSANNTGSWRALFQVVLSNGLRGTTPGTPALP